MTLALFSQSQSYTIASPSYWPQALPIYSADSYQRKGNGQSKKAYSAFFILFKCTLIAKNKNVQE